MDTTTLRALQDKVYDKRKHAAFLLEAQIKDHIAKNEYDKVDQILAQLSALALNPNPSWRWGGVMGLAACSIALGPEIPNHLAFIVPPIISCFGDPDSKVRYFSCESMYNVAKVAKGEILVYFNDLFDTLSKLAADPDPAVKNGAELLDRLIKDIVTEQAATYVSVVAPSRIQSTSSCSPTTSLISTPLPSCYPRSLNSTPHSQPHLERAFSLESFIPLLRERIYNYNPFTRQYLVSWLQLLNSIPEINLVSYLPDFLDGLIKYLTDAGSEIQVAVQHLLADLLVEIDKVMHANENRERQRMHKRHLGLQRKAFEDQMEEGQFDRRPLPINFKSPTSGTENSNVASQSCSPEILLSSKIAILESEGSSSTHSRAATIVVNKCKELVDAPDVIGLKGESNRGFEEDQAQRGDEEMEEDEVDDGELGTYVQGQGVELDLYAIVQILVGWMGQPENCDETEAICLRWINELIRIDESVIIPFTPRLIPIILTCLSHYSTQIKTLAIEVNENLSRAIENLPTPAPLPPIPPVPPPSSIAVPPNSNPSYERREKAKNDKFNPSATSLNQDKARQRNMGNERGNLATTLSATLSWGSRFQRRRASEKIDEETLNFNGIVLPLLDPGPEPPTPEEEATPSTDPFDYNLTVSNLTLQFLNPREDTRLAALTWLIMLHQKLPDRILTLQDGSFPALLKTLSDESESVIKSDLQLLSQISLRSLETTDQQGNPAGFYYRHFMSNLLSLFGTDRNLLEERGNLIVRVLCLYLGPERIYKTFAEDLEKDEDLEFASSMVQNLNLIMITSPELSEMRKKLKQLETKDSVQLFIHLYRSFSHNPVSTLTLCLLSPLAYEHAFNLLNILANEMEITVGLLIQVDKLVQLLESPVFTSLRLQLLEPDKHPFLYKALYGILMLLPQSSAFATLRNRLGAVSTLGYAHAVPKTPHGLSNPPTNLSITTNNPRSNKTAQTKTNEPTPEQIPWNSLLHHFKSLQTRHEKVRRQQNSHLISGRDHDDSRVYLPEQQTHEEQMYGAGVRRTSVSPSPVASSLGLLPHPTSFSPQVSHHLNQHQHHHRFGSTSAVSQSGGLPSKIPSSMVANHMRRKSQVSMNNAAPGPASSAGLNHHQPRKSSAMAGSAVSQQSSGGRGSQMRLSRPTTDRNERTD